MRMRDYFNILILVLVVITGLVLVFSFTGYVSSESYESTEVKSCDLNGDGVVDMADIKVWLLMRRTDNPDADINGDGVVNSRDMHYIRSNFGPVSDEPEEPDNGSKIDDGSGSGENDTLDETLEDKDTTPPTANITVPTAGQVFSAGTTSTLFLVTTNELATCRWSDIDQAYSDMLSTNTMNGSGTKNHTSILTGLQDGMSYIRYVRCVDTSENVMDSSASVVFSVASLPISLTCEAIGNSKCWYVAPNGNDTHNGTIEKPFKTFRPAVTQAGPGDFIYARGGVYTDNNLMRSGVWRVKRNVASSAECAPGQYFTENSCFVDTYMFIKVGDISGWASYDTGYTVQHGTAEQPITIKSYPGEIAHLYSPPGTRGTAVAITKSYYVLEGFKIEGAKIGIWGGTRPNNPHDITIRNNEVFGIGIPGGDNPGIIRIDRGDDGGAYNIFIHNNTLHDIWDTRIEGSTYWGDTKDFQHYGAVTTLSAEVYQGFEKGSTGYIEIINNTIYNVPQAFFFKNPMEGPILIKNNHIYNTRNMGLWHASNVWFINNLVHDALGGGPWGGSQHYTDERIRMNNGWNYIIENNTFVNVSKITSGGTGNQTIRGNVVTGLRGEADGMLWNWDVPRLLFKSETSIGINDPSQSLLQTWNVNNNCLISTAKTMGYLRQRATVDGKTVTKDYSHEQQLPIFKFGTNDIIMEQQDPLSLFNNPENGDYSIKAGHPCAGMGAQF